MTWETDLKLLWQHHPDAKKIPWVVWDAYLEDINDITRDKERLKRMRCSNIIAASYPFAPNEDHLKSLLHILYAYPDTNDRELIDAMLRMKVEYRYALIAAAITGKVALFKLIHQSYRASFEDGSLIACGTTWLGASLNAMSRWLDSKYVCIKISNDDYKILRLVVQNDHEEMLKHLVTFIPDDCHIGMVKKLLPFALYNETPDLARCLLDMLPTFIRDHRIQMAFRKARYLLDSSTDYFNVMSNIQALLSSDSTSEFNRLLINEHFPYMVFRRLPYMAIEEQANIISDFIERFSLDTFSQIVAGLFINPAFRDLIDSGPLSFIELLCNLAEKANQEDALKAAICAHLVHSSPHYEFHQISPGKIHIFHQSFKNIACLLQRYPEMIPLVYQRNYDVDHYVFDTLNNWYFYHYRGDGYFRLADKYANDENYLSYYYVLISLVSGLKSQPSDIKFIAFLIKILNFNSQLNSGMRLLIQAFEIKFVSEKRDDDSWQSHPFANYLDIANDSPVKQDMIILLSLVSIHSVHQIDRHFIRNVLNKAAVHEASLEAISQFLTSQCYDFTDSKDTSDSFRSSVPHIFLSSPYLLPFSIFSSHQQRTHAPAASSSNTASSCQENDDISRSILQA